MRKHQEEAGNKTEKGRKPIKGMLLRKLLLLATESQLC